ncbi:tetratricopeptide repeat protein [uncultured Draconibacterium sp.]|uniref:tetratricopeptide repeat protein n=1 Tax=uncultured Draconibacterium sp. TaxID=1573823 RepID=UPI0025F011F8|nr:tetratricopeptide repeat protein [uncultured Draconibacterium sp.]
MERTKHFIVILLLIVAMSGFSRATNKDKIYRAYTSNRMDNWKTVMDSMELNKSRDTTYLIELVNYQYGYIGYCLGMRNKQAAKTYLDLAQNNLAVLEEQSFPPAVIHAYKAAFYGFKIGIHPFKAPVLGRQCVKHVNQALQLNNKLPFAHIQYGNTYFYMPAVFGGSKKVAIEHFLMAIKLMEKEPDSLKNDWNYLSLLSTTGQSYEEMEEYEKAKAIYEKVLKIAPDFQWVKDELYPNIKTKLAEK